MDKVIDKAVFDVIIQLVRDYWNCAPIEEETKRRLKAVRRFLTEHFPEYNSLYDLLNMLFGQLRVSPGITNYAIYGALECLGWRVKDEEQVS